MTAHLGEDVGMDEIPPCDACTGEWQAAYDADGYVDEDERCPHRLVVGEFELVKVRWSGSQNPYWAMREESQSLSGIAEAIFNEEPTDYTEEFREQVGDEDIDDLLVLYKAELADAWRGFGLGPMIVADALRRLSPGCGAVMVHPTPIDASGMTKDQWIRARQGLRETWARIGFVPYAKTPYMIYATKWADPQIQQVAVREELEDLSAEWRAARAAARVSQSGLNS